MPYKRLAILVPGFLILTQFANAQTIKNIDDFLMPPKDSLPKILLVGSFHFAYYNADAYKVDKDKQVDILSAQKQQELTQLINYISLFKPTKILIEATPLWKAMEKYRQYRENKNPVQRDERMQIAFRLLQQFKLDTVYSIDAGSIADDLSSNKDSAIIKPYIDSIFKDYAFRANDRYTQYMDYETSLSAKIPLLDYFKFLNSPQRLRRDYGAYLVGDFKLGEFRGADALATYWYDRNLRIFRNIQKATTSPKDRILVLFGAGHIAVLDQLLTASTEYNYIKFNDLKK
jgi:hypothetical protein